MRLRLGERARTAGSKKREVAGAASAGSSSASMMKLVLGFG